MPAVVVGPAGNSEITCLMNGERFPEMAGGRSESSGTVMVVYRDAWKAT